MDLMGQIYLVALTFLASCIVLASCELVPLPDFAALRAHYPGYAHHGGLYHNHQALRRIGVSPQDASLLLHDTSALRLSYALNRIGGRHSLGRTLIRLSKFGYDSVSGKDGLEYIYNPIAYGPYFADKYGYPTVSKLHEQDPLSTKKNFWGRQGILRVITYTRNKNLPKGHVALWDCNHFHQSKDWIAGHSLITVEFWESPDSNCSSMETEARYQVHSPRPSSHPSSLPSFPPSPSSSSSSSSSSSLLGRLGAGRSKLEAPPSDNHLSLSDMLEASRPHPHLRHKHWERKFVHKHHLGEGRS